MGKQPRQHHFVPQFYLAGFTKSSSTEGDLYVFDQNQLKTWKSNPKKTARQRDFYEIDAGPLGDGMVVEKSLSKLEGQWSSAIRSVIQQQILPDDESFGDLMVFVAFMAVRVRRIRKVLSGFIDQVSKAEIFATLATEEGRASFRQVIEGQDRQLSDEEFEQLVDFGQSGQYEVDYEQTWHVQQIILQAAMLAPNLSERNWALWIAEDDVPDLICSDSPVVPTWATPVRGAVAPGFGTPNTVISVPLNRRIALVSMSDAALPGRRLDRAGVAMINSATGSHANELYAPEPDFVWAMTNHQVGSSTDLFTSLREGVRATRRHKETFEAPS